MQDRILSFRQKLTTGGKLDLKAVEILRDTLLNMMDNETDKRGKTYGILERRD